MKNLKFYDKAIKAQINNLLLICSHIFRFSFFTTRFSLLVFRFSLFTTRFSLLVVIFTACTNQETIPAVFKNPSIEAVSAYSISETDGEVIVSFSEVYQSIPEIGVVWADKPSPTTADNVQSQLRLTEDTEYTFSISNLQKNKVHYIRGYFKFDNKITYSNEIEFTPNFSSLWTKIPSPPLGSNEYVSPDDVIAADYGNSFKCYKVNRLTNNSTLLAYYRYDNGWNPTFFRNQLDPNPAPRAMLFNPIYVQFQSAVQVLSLYGGGYQKLPQNRGQIYKRAVYILESDGAWEPYPGAEARTSAFGIGKSPYIIENLPNGKIWTIDFKNVKWIVVGQVPITKPAKLITFDVGERVFVLVEPENPADLLHEFYEYIVAENRWKRLANFDGEPRRSGSGITVGDKIFFGIGQSAKDYRPLRDIWQYEIGTNKWTKKTNYPGVGTLNNFIVNDYVSYVGFGQQYKKSSVGGDDYKQANDLWQFTPY